MELETLRNLQYGEVSLKEDQLLHFRSVYEIIDKNYFYIDTSPMGRGKTAVALFLSSLIGRRIVIFTEKSCVNTWKEFAGSMNIKSSRITIIPYTMIPGRKNNKSEKTCLEGFLLRKDYVKITKKGIAKDKTSYSITSEGRDFFDRKIVIFDEFHVILGNSLTFKALREINRVAVRTCKLGFLSATPGTSDVKLVNFFRLINVYTEKKLSYTHNLTGKKIFQGFQQILDYCNSIDSSSTDKSIRAAKNSIKKVEIPELCSALWNGVVKKYFASRMEDFVVKCNGHNGLFTMTKEELDYYLISIEDLAAAVKWDGRDFSEGVRNNGLQQTACRNIEMSKLGIFYRRAKWSLSKPRTKVVFWLNYIRTIENFEELLSGTNYALIRGSTKDEERIRIIKTFNQPTDEITLLLISAKTIATGLSLHDSIPDADGKGWQRDVYISPNFDFTRMQQFIGRFLRVGYLSIPNIYVVYPDYSKNKLAQVESRMIEVSEKKSVFLRQSSSTKNVLNTVVFTNEFPKYVEKENRYRME